MRNFFTGIEATVRGYTVKEAEMRFTPEGKPVTSVRLGCGGSEKRPATFVDVSAWESTAERLNELADRKGLAVIAVGVISQRKWKYNDKWYERIELVYLSELQVQVSEDKFETITIEKKTKEEIKEAVASAVNAKPTKKKAGGDGAGGEEEAEPVLEPDDIPF